uniref:Protein SIX6OS1 isoform X6 n=1 Tax=Geotrypetes seraphini TaxID=260995 RepID=A0A6P8RMN7_GEOSA|nr:protein SIX6OS1 isoform X6 [Geotrypetes seraphini]
MNDKSLSNLDKLLVELVFQLEQDSHSKEHITEQIHLYTANVVEVKQQIHGLQENINKSDHDILCLRKHSKYSKDNHSVWKPTYIVFNNHEAYLECQLQNYREATERDKKIYEEHINQYKEILQQHQALYTESVLAKAYYMKKAELDDIQNRILKCSEQLKWKEAALIDLQGEQEKENDMNQLTASSIPLSDNESVKNNTQKYKEFTVNTRTNCGQDPSVTSLQNQMQFRLHVPQRQTKGKNGSQFTATETDNSDSTKAASKTRDSAYASQVIFVFKLKAIHKESFTTPEEVTDRLEENSDIFSRIPECLQFPRTPEQSFFPTTSVTSTFMQSSESTVNKEEFSKTPTFEQTNNVGCEGQTSKSPAFSFLMTSTPKSPHFNLFESSVFETTNSSDQQYDSYSDGNVNPASPHKEMGCLFGKLEKDEFTFNFHPEPSSQAFGNGKDEFSFPFSFGQDQRLSQTSSFKGFQSSSQNTMHFKFF